MGGQEVDEAHRTDAEAAAVFADHDVDDQVFGGRYRIHLASFSASERRAAWPGVVAAPGQMPAMEGTAVRTSVVTQ